MNTKTEHALINYLKAQKNKIGNNEFSELFENGTLNHDNAMNVLYTLYSHDISNRGDVVDYMIYLQKNYEEELCDYLDCIIRDVENDDIERILEKLPDYVYGVLAEIGDGYSKKEDPNYFGRIEIKTDFSTKSGKLAQIFLNELFSTDESYFPHYKELMRNCIQSMKGCYLPRVVPELIRRKYYDLIDILADRYILTLYCDFVYSRRLLKDAAGRKVVPDYIFKGPYANAKINDRAGYTGAFLLREEMLLDNFRKSIRFTPKLGKRYPIRELTYHPSEELDKIRLLNLQHPAILEIIDNQIKWIAEQMDLIVNPDRNLEVVYKRILNWQLSKMDVSAILGLMSTPYLKGLMDDLPLIVLSDELPPKDKKLEEENIFDMLGYYEPGKQRIVLLRVLIEDAAEHLECSAGALRAVVLAHELGHFLTHAYTYDGTAQEYPLGDFSNTDVVVKETIAQLFALYASANNPELAKVFSDLAKNQSYPYTQYPAYTSVGIDRLIRSIIELRKMGRPATMQDWNAIIKTV